MRVPVVVLGLSACRPIAASTDPAPPPPVAQAPASTPPAGALEAASGTRVTGPPSEVCGRTLARTADPPPPPSGDPEGWANGRSTLDLRGRGTITADDLYAALSAPGAAALDSLDLSGLSLGGAGKALAATALPGLRRLWLEDTALGEVGFRALFFAEGLPALEVLDASGAGLDEAALAGLRTAPVLGGLRTLDLRDSRVAGVDILAALNGAHAPRLVCLAVTEPVPAAERAAWASRGVTLVLSP